MIMTTLRMRLSLEEIETCQRQMEVHAVPGDTGQLLDFCIQQWNKLNKGLLRDALMEFAHSSGYNLKERNFVHQWFHDISPKWCHRFGHMTPSTFFDFLVPNPPTEYNKDTKHRLVEAWLAWVVIQKTDWVVLGMIPDIMLFLRSLCEVYHSHFYLVTRGSVTMNHPDELQRLAEDRIIQQQQWADPQDPAPPHPAPPRPAPPRRNRWNRQTPSSSAPVEDPDEVPEPTPTIFNL